MMSLNFKRAKVKVGVYKNKIKNKKDILFLHGLGSSTLNTSGKILAKMPQNRIIGIDWLGHGETTKLFRKQDTYNAYYMSDYLDEVLKNLIKRKYLTKNFSIVANSMSAIPIAYLYPKYKNKFKKIIFINPAGLDKKMGYIFAFFSRNITRSSFWPWFFSFWILNNKARKNLRKNLRIRNWRIIVSKYAISSYNFPGNMKKICYVPEKFEKIKCPVLLICGRKDSIFTKREYLNFAKNHSWKVSVKRKEEHSLGTGNSGTEAEEIREFFKL